MPWVDVDKIPHDPLSRREEREIDEYLRKQRARARFYTDANFPQPAVELLRGNGLDVLTAYDAGLGSRSDEDHIAVARKEGRVLLTCDRDFLSDLDYPLLSCPAIVVFDFGRGTADDMLRAFHALNPILAFPEMHDKWCKFAASRNEWTQTMRFQDGSTSRERNRFHNGRLQVWIDATGT